MSTMEPNMEVIETPGSISGPQIIADLCDRIAAQLARDCNLRASDCYEGYAATATIIIQLPGVYATEVAAQIDAGRIDSALPVRKVTVKAEVQAEPDAGNLERPIDSEGVTENPAKLPRIYVSRTRGTGKVGS